LKLSHVTSSGKLETGTGCIHVMKSFSFTLIISAFNMVFFLHFASLFVLILSEYLLFKWVVKKMLYRYIFVSARLVKFWNLVVLFWQINESNEKCRLKV